MKDIWTVKYKPKKLDDIAGNEFSINTLKKILKSNNLPHLIFQGPVNSGKSSTAFALANELYGKHYENNFTYFNASDFFDQGKRYLVRDRRFARIIGTQDPKKIRMSVLSIFKQIINEYASMRPIDSDYKIIFIDDAQSLDSSSQQALRRIMEKYTSTCRFILSTTQPSKLIQPLKSRGLRLFFTYVTEKELKDYIQPIAENEGIQFTEDGLEALWYVSRGNISRALTTTQIAYLHSKDEDTNISLQDIYEAVLNDIPEKENIDQLFSAAVNKDIDTAHKIIDNLLIESGFSGYEILESLYDVAVESGDNDLKVADMVKKIAEIDFHILDAANARIQLEYLITDLY
ncbi:AAA family ATPase [Methanohalobium sp.]|uniref:AAA family ATPase n=1 Tax=Methanohalobium sp. TaxID=2837493 RepID=UPI0025EC656C|nr:AAA family ATPase [Methanohalobium sp.]